MTIWKRRIAANDSYTSKRLTLVWINLKLSLIFRRKQYFVHALINVFFFLHEQHFLSVKIFTDLSFSLNE